MTRTLRQAEALQRDPVAANAATAHARLGRLIQNEHLARTAHDFCRASDEEMLAEIDPAALTQGVHTDQ